MIRNKRIYHILSKEEWQKSKKLKYYIPASFKQDGFIHCSTRKQVLATANRRYSRRRDLLLLVINAEKIYVKIVYEDTSGQGEKHPHVYGKISINAITNVLQLKPASSGQFTNFPKEGFK